MAGSETKKIGQELRLGRAAILNRTRSVYSLPIGAGPDDGHEPRAGAPLKAFNTMVNDFITDGVPITH